MPKYGLTAGVNKKNVNTSMKVFMTAVGVLVDSDGNPKDSLAKDYIKPICDYFKKERLDPFETTFSVYSGGGLNQEMSLYQVIQNAVSEAAIKNSSIDFEKMQKHILTQFSDLGLYCSPEDKKELNQWMNEVPSASPQDAGKKTNTKSNRTTSSFCVIS